MARSSFHTEGDGDAAQARDDSEHGRRLPSHACAPGASRREWVQTFSQQETWQAFSDEEIFAIAAAIAEDIERRAQEAPWGE